VFREILSDGVAKLFLTEHGNSESEWLQIIENNLMQDLRLAHEVNYTLTKALKVLHITMRNLKRVIITIIP
jgi:hypothetical protein